MLAIRKNTGTKHKCHIWRKNGDHPKDRSRMVNDVQAPYLSDGNVVRRGRLHETHRDICTTCHVALYKHGEIINETGAKWLVCPGDYVVEESVNGKPHYISVPAAFFNDLYEEVKK